MFRKVNVLDHLVIVENMSYFYHAERRTQWKFSVTAVWGKEEAARQNIPFLGEVPIFTEIREGGDQGMLIVVSTLNTARQESIRYSNRGNAGGKNLK